MSGNDLLDQLAGGNAGAGTGAAEADGGLASVLPAVATWSSHGNGAPGVEGIYMGEGRNISAIGQRNTRSRNPRYNAAVVEAAQLYKRVLGGNRWAALQFSEAMSTSDFPLLFGDILSRQILGYYSVIPVQWEWTARRSRVPDFRTVKRFAVDGAELPLDMVPELTGYPAAALTELSYEYKVAKHGRRVPMSWETRINDDLDAFSRMPQRLARAARFSEEKFATELYVGVGGPNAVFFTVGHANIITGNPALSVPGLEAALTAMASQRDVEGNPIFVDGFVLEVPPSLEVRANNIVNAIEIRSANGGGDGTGNDQLTVKNWLSGRLRVKVNPWLPIIDGTANDNSTWYVWANPNNDSRPAMEIGFLTGHEQPEMFMKSPNSIRVGGGDADVMAGDFDSDAIEWKVRHVYGGTLMDYRMGVVSNGTGI